MKRRSDRKRQAILDAAYRLFRTNGFEKTTMSDISTEVGGSKATVYNYFPSKEELFVECMSDVMDRYLENVFAGLHQPRAELPATLLRLSKTALRLVCTPEMLASKRLLIAEAERSGIGRLFHQKAMFYLKELSEFLSRAMEAGQLRASDPMLAAHQLRALIEADIMDRCLLGAERCPPSAAAISRAAENAVSTFLLAYERRGEESQAERVSGQPVKRNRIGTNGRNH